MCETDGNNIDDAVIGLARGRSSDTVEPPAEAPQPAPKRPARPDVQALLEPGMEARRRRDDVAALAHFTSVAAEYPDLLEVQFQIAMTLCRLGRPAEATACCEKVALRAPGNDRNTYILGLIARERKDDTTALRQFKAAASAKPRNLTYLVEVAQTLRSLKRYSEARSYCTNILELDPRHFRALSLLGYLAWSERDYRSALAHFEAAAAVDPQNQDVQLKIGVALRELGRREEAETHLRNLWVRESQGVGPALALVSFLRQQRRLPEALEILESTAEKFPQNRELQLESGRVLQGLKRFDEAKNKFLAVLEETAKTFRHC